MFKISFNYISVLALIVFTSVVFARLSDEIIEERLRLSSVLDSIELEKQTLKRTGKSLKILDERSREVRDSIEKLRSEMPLTVVDESHVINSNSEIEKFNILKPKTFIDWVILFAGVVALLSGLILIFGLFSSFFGKKKNIKVQNFKTNSTGTLSEKLAVNKKSRTVFDKKETLRPASESSDISFLRGKIQNTESNSFPNPSPFERAESRPASIIGETPRSNIEAEIIVAHKSGVSTVDIAKKYKMSVDQVSLMLRMSGNG